MLRTVTTFSNGDTTIRTVCADCGDKMRDAEHWRQHRSMHARIWWTQNHTAEWDRYVDAFDAGFGR